MGKIEKKFFFDTYAFFEIIKKNPNYENYVKDVGVITTKLNLIELHYNILKEAGKQEADFHYDRLSPFAMEISDEIIKIANEFKLINKRKRLSYADCIGYVLAKSLNVKFLTGDKQFEHFDNVEFVK